MSARDIQLARTFVTLADTLVQDFDLTDLLHTLTTACVEHLDVTAAGILLAGPSGTMQVVASSDERTRLLELFESQNDEGPCTDCHTSGEWVSARDLETEERWPTFRARALAEGFRAVDAFPMRLRTTQVGALNLFAESAGGLDQDDRRVAQALADVATIGLLQERAVRESQVLAEQLQRALRSRVTIEQAKGILAEQGGTSVDLAFHRLRARARATQRSLHEVAQQVVDGQLHHDELG